MDFAKSIEGWTALSKTDCDMKDIESLLNTVYFSMPIPTLTIAPPFLARARINKSNEIFSHKGHLSYNPDPATIPPQRGNYAGQQVFYAALPASNSEHGIGHCQNTAMLETVWEYVIDWSKARQYMTISRWPVTRPLNVCMLSFAPETWEKNEDFKRAAEFHKNFIIKKDSEKSSRYIEALEYMSRIFFQKDGKRDCYKISAAYFNFVDRAMKANNMPFDGLVYPSANTGGAGMNIVLRKDVIDDGSIQFDFAMMMAMQRDPNNPKHIMFPPASSEEVPDADGRFFFKNVW